MLIDITTVDSFSDRAFSGNPAAVCLLEDPLTPETMQSIAMEMNLSETAFVERTADPSNFNLRWFTPTLEIDLCGHATLASAFVMVQAGWVKAGETMRFQTLSGELRVKSDGEFIEMDFPLIPTKVEKHLFFSDEFLGYRIVNSSSLKKNWIFELESWQNVLDVKPDFDLIAKHSEEGIIITAAGTGGFDCYSRFFGPNVGVPEDPVTGFAHCALMDYWNQRAGKSELKAFQASKRGGELLLEKQEDRVIIKGKVVKVLSGTIEF